MLKWSIRAPTSTYISGNISGTAVDSCHSSTYHREERIGKAALHILDRITLLWGAGAVV